MSIPNIEFKVEGQPTDVDAPPIKLKEKTTVKRVEISGKDLNPRHPADIMARDLLANDSC